MASARDLMLQILMSHPAMGGATPSMPFGMGGVQLAPPPPPDWVNHAREQLVSRQHVVNDATSRGSVPVTGAVNVGPVPQSSVRDQQVTRGRIANDANSRGGVPDTVNSNGVPLDVNSVFRPEEGVTGLLGGLFGSTSYSWGPRASTSDQHPLPNFPTHPKPSTPFAEFMTQLMFGSPKDEHGRRVGIETNGDLWSRIAPYLERAYASDESWKNDPAMKDALSRIMPATPGNYHSRQDNRFLTPEERGDEFTRQYGPTMDEYNRRVEAGFAPFRPHGEGVDRNWRYDQLMQRTQKMLQDLFP